MRKTLLFLIVGIFAISFTSAFIDLGSVKKNECVEVFQICDNCTYVNISSMEYPNNTVIYPLIQMSNVDINYNYSFCDTSQLGIYYFKVKGDKDGEISVEEGQFEVTPSGQVYDTGQSLGGLGIFVGVLAVAFAFMFIGSKLSQEDKTLPFGFFFMVLAIMLVIFSLHLGWTFSVDLLQHETISEGISTIFLVVLWGTSGIALIFFVLMFIGMIKEITRVLDKKKFGEDFNPITGVYE